MAGYRTVPIGEIGIWAPRRTFLALPPIEQPRTGLLWIDNDQLSLIVRNTCRVKISCRFVLS